MLHRGLQHDRRHLRRDGLRQHRGLRLCTRLDCLRHDTYSDATFSENACDGAGVCAAGVGKACANNFGCANVINCDNVCSDNTTCAVAAFCDKTNRVCCTGLASGGTLSVDGATGTDSDCCGIGGNGACQSITQAMKLIDAAQAQNVTINVTVNGGGGDWAVAGEVYPIKLGWGVELNAPGVYFIDVNSSSVPPHNEIFDVTQYSTNDSVGYVSIVGAQGNQVGIGMDSSGGQTWDSAALNVDANQTLYIANASVNTNASNGSGPVAIYVEPSGSLLFGQDQSGGRARDGEYRKCPSMPMRPTGTTESSASGGTPAVPIRIRNSCRRARAA